MISSHSYVHIKFTTRLTLFLFYENLLLSKLESENYMIIINIAIHWHYVFGFFFFFLDLQSVHQ